MKVHNISASVIDPIVSVCMITYNHQEFVSQAIDTIMSQQCDFEFQLIISDDHSSDNTLAICKEYQSKFPSKIIVIENDPNIGMMKNFIQVLSFSNSLYIAICEGDDYWTSNTKLQSQIDILRNNNTISIVAHHCDIYYQNKNEFEPFHKKNVKEILTLQDFIYGNYINTLSIVYRNNNVGFSDWMYQSKLGDWPLNLLLLQNGNVQFINESMGVYRIHSGGIHQNAYNWDLMKRKQSFENAIFVLKNLENKLKPKFPKDFKISFSNYTLDKAWTELKMKEYKNFIQSIKTLVFSFPISSLKVLITRKVLKRQIRNIYQ
jgi:glycosyltransferase involved in cell wall biosynthesis